MPEQMGVLDADGEHRSVRFERRYEADARFELHPAEGGGTELVVEHRLLSAEAGTGYAAGWHAHLDLVEEELAGGVRSDWQARYDALLPHYEHQAGMLTGQRSRG